MTDNKPKRPAFEKEYKTQQKNEKSIVNSTSDKQEEKTKKRRQKMSPVKLAVIICSICAGIGISGVIAFNQYQKSEAAKAASEAQVVTTMADMSGDSTESGSGDISVGEDEVKVEVQEDGELLVEDNITKVLNEQGTDDNKSEAQTTKTEAEIKELQGSEQPDFVIEPYDDTTMYCSSSTGVNVRSLPTANSDKLGFLNQNEKVTMNGLVTSYQGQECLWYQIKFGDSGDSVAYVNASYLGERPVETTASQQTSTSSSSQAQSSTTQQQAAAAQQEAAAQQQAAAAAAAASAQAAPVTAADAQFDAMWVGDVPLIEGSDVADFN